MNNDEISTPGAPPASETTVVPDTADSPSADPMMNLPTPVHVEEGAPIGESHGSPLREQQ
jgi:hypothetical protein